MIKRTMIATIIAASLLMANSVVAEDYMSAAREYLDKGEYKAAIIQLKNQLKNEPKDANARYLLGLGYLKSGQVAQAEKELSKAYRLDRTNPESCLTYAKLLLLKKEYNKVNDVLGIEFTDKKQEEQRQVYRAYAYLGLEKLDDSRQILNNIIKQGENVEAYNGLAKIALQENETDTASEWIELSLNSDAENKYALQLKAKLLNIKKKHDDALEKYTALIKSYPNDLNLYNERAGTYLVLNKLQNSEKDIKYVLEKIYNHPQANFLLSMIKLQQGHFKEAQNASQAVLNMSPHHYPSMLILSTANFGQGSFFQAEKYIIQYLSANPDNIEAQNLLANIYLAQGKVEQVLLILDDIEEEKKNQNANILTTLGSAYLLAGEHKKGVEALQQAKALQPDNTLIQQRLITGQYRAGDLENAIKSLENMLADSKNNNLNNSLVVLYIQNKEFQKAENKLNELLEKSPDDKSLYNLLAVVEKLKGNIKEAETAYQKALVLDEKYIPALMGLAELETGKNNLLKAKDYYNQVIQVNNKYTKAYIALAGIAEIKNNFQEVENNFLTGYKNVSGNVKSQVTMASLLGKWYVKQKQEDKILPVAEELNNAYPDEVSTTYFLAAAQIANKRDLEAEQTLTQFIKKDKTDTKNRMLLVRLLARDEGRESDVIRLLDDVIDITPNNTKPVAFKAAYLIGLHQYQQALKVSDYAQNHFSGQSLGYLIKGEVYFYQKNFHKALENYQKAYEIQPDNNVLFRIVDVYLIQDDRLESVKLLEDELKKNNRNLNALFKLAIIYQQSKQADKAITQYLKILDIDNDNAYALNNLAWLYSQQNNPQAISLARKAYEKIPESAAIADTYGYMLVQQGDLEEGIKIIEKAVQKSPERYDIQFHLAKGYYLAGKNDKASNILKTILNSGKNFTENENAQILLKKIKT